MNIVKVTDEKYDYICKFVQFLNENGKVDYDLSGKWIDEGIKFMKENGFIFDRFHLRLGDRHLWKVEIDKDVLFVKEIDLRKNKGTKVIFTFDDWCNGEIKDDTGEKVKGVDPLCIMLVYIVQEAMKQDVIFVEETNRRYTGKKSSNKGNTDKVYTLEQCIRKYARHINHCKHVITCEHWEVRGHYRHLKNGKTVYVKPFEKGRNRNSRLKDKVYTL